MTGRSTSPPWIEPSYYDRNADITAIVTIKFKVRKYTDPWSLIMVHRKGLNRLVRDEIADVGFEAITSRADEYKVLSVGWEWSDREGEQGGPSVGSSDDCDCDCAGDPD